MYCLYYINRKYVIMNILNFFSNIKTKIENLDSEISTYNKYKDIYNPFFYSIPKTYVWIEDKDKK